MIDWSYGAWPSGEPYDWGGAARGNHPDDNLDFHVDLGCGKVKKGRIGIDRYPAPGVNVVANLDAPWGALVEGLPKAPGEDAHAPHPALASRGLPFADSSIESIVSHHCLEHIGPGFIPLMDEIYRVLKPDAILRVIVPLFPSSAAVEDPDHRRFFMAGTLDAFCGFPDHIWCDEFAVPYTKARFISTHKDMSPLTPIHQQWGPEDRRELRQTLRAVKS